MRSLLTLAAIVSRSAARFDCRLAPQPAAGDLFLSSRRPFESRRARTPCASPISSSGSFRSRRARGPVNRHPPSRRTRDFSARGYWCLFFPPIPPSPCPSQVQRDHRNGRCTRKNGSDLRHPTNLTLGGEFPVLREHARNNGRTMSSESFSTFPRASRYYRTGIICSRFASISLPHASPPVRPTNLAEHASADATLIERFSRLITRACKRKRCASCNL